MTLGPTDNKVTELISAAQNLTDAWADLGPELDCRDVEKIALWLKLDINSSNNARVRVLAKQSEGATDEYLLPINTKGTSSVSTEPEYYEFNTDADQNVVFAVETNDLFPFIQFQIQAGTVGATAGQIDAAGVGFASRRRNV